MNKYQYKILVSNLRATRKAGQDFTINSYPVWGSTYKWQWAQYIAFHVLGWDLTPLND